MSPASRSRASRGAVTLAALLACAGVRAHDTWFAPLAPDAHGGVALALGTGNHFPVHESAIDAKYLVRSGCRAASDGRTIALQRSADAPNALQLRAQAAPTQALSCWAQTTPFEVELARRWTC
jgi:hypothetical protein